MTKRLLRRRRLERIALPTDEGQVFAEAVRHEQWRIVHAALMQMEWRDRYVILCRYGLFGMQRKTQAEIASHLGITQPRLWQIEHRAKERLVGLISQNRSRHT